MLLDGRFGGEVRAGLEKLGHEVTVATPYYDRSPYAEPNGIQVAGEELRSAVYPVAKPTHEIDDVGGEMGDVAEGLVLDLSVFDGRFCARDGSGRSCPCSGVWWWLRERRLFWLV